MWQCLTLISLEPMMELDSLHVSRRARCSQRGHTSSSASSTDSTSLWMNQSHVQKVLQSVDTCIVWPNNGSRHKNSIIIQNLGQTLHMPGLLWSCLYCIPTKICLQVPLRPPVISWGRSQAGFEQIGCMNLAELGRDQQVIPCRHKHTCSYGLCVYIRTFSLVSQQ